CWLALQGGVAWLDEASWYRVRHSPAQRHGAFVCEFLHERAAELGRSPSVYWYTDLRDIWFRAGASAYFHSVQLSGCAYNRGTAMEGRRRADLVGRFETELLQRTPAAYQWWQKALVSFFGPRSAPKPTEADLLALCADEGI